MNEINNKIKISERSLAEKQRNVADLSDKNNVLKNQNNINSGENDLVKGQIKHTILINKEILEEINKFVEVESEAKGLLERKQKLYELKELSAKCVAK